MISPRFRRNITLEIDVINTRKGLFCVIESLCNIKTESEKGRRDSGSLTC